MHEYHKIQTVFLRDPDTNHKTLLRGQYALPEFEYLAKCLWVFTEKVDGTNIRIGWDGDSVAFGGRTDNAQIPTFLLSALNELFPLDKFQSLCPSTPMTLYGEGYGPKIQKGGGNYRDTPSFVLFDVNVGGVWLERENVNDIGGMLGIDRVPVISCGPLRDMVSMAKEGFRSMWGDFGAEGIVARPATELFSRNGKRIITKVKCKDFPAL